MEFFIDDHLSTTGNIVAAVGVFFTLANNVPQLLHTWKYPTMGDFSTTSIVLRIVANILWMVYATDLGSVLLQASVTISLLSALFLFVYKLRDLQTIHYTTLPST